MRRVFWSAALVAISGLGVDGAGSVLSTRAALARPQAAAAPSVQTPVEKEKGAMSKQGVSLWSDPIGRALFLESAKPQAVAQAYAQLLAGDTTAFAAVALWVLAGHPISGAAAPESPAAAFFRELFEHTPAAERDAFLKLCLRGQLANSGILARAPRVVLTADAASAERVVRYLAAFTAPTPAADPQRLLDAELRLFATYPDPRMVRIAGALGLRAATPHLERFLALPRRFFHLHTDYSTRPEPVDALFVESLRALVEIGGRDREAAEAVQAVLVRSLKSARQQSAGDALSGDGEPIVLESYRDHQGQAPPTRDVRTTRLARSKDVRDKVAWLTLVQAVLRGDGAQRAVLFRAESDRQRAPIAEAVWSVESDSAEAALAGDRLHIVTNIFVSKQHRRVLWSLDAASGKTRFIVPLGGSGDDGADLVTHALLADPDGAPVLLATMRSGRSNDTRIFRFDPETGEVQAAHRIAESGREDVSLLAADADGYLLRRGQTVLRQGRDGSLRWRWAVPRSARVAIAEGTIVALLQKEVQLRSSQGERTLAAQQLLGTADLDESAIPLALRDGFAVADPRTQALHLFDLEGKRRGQWPLAQGADTGSRLEGPWAGRTLLGRDQVQVLTPAGALRELASPLNVSQVLVTPTAVYLGSERALVEQPLGGGAVRKLPDLGSAHMARVLAADATRIFMLVYKDGYQLISLNRAR